jgi:XRE family transcriptional regulator, fatty acid utilization regulator
MIEDYAKAFRIVRAAFGLQQAELAARMPITASQLSLIESGKRQPSVKVVNALASAVDIPTALITLLASSGTDMGAKTDDEISDLARALLRALVSAETHPQQHLKLQRKSG